MAKLALGLLFHVFTLSILLCQRDTNTIVLINPSFEGVPSCCKPPTGWIDCGWKNESPPDIQPDFTSDAPLFGVKKKPFDGNTYLGMVARDNDTYERISQKLSQPLKKDRCYAFSVYMCRSKDYLSASTKDTLTRKPYTTPIVLRIYTGDAFCHQRELLAVSQAVVDTNWRVYTFEFRPTADGGYIELEAFYKTPILVPYNGNILLDKASEIKRIPCPNENKEVKKKEKILKPSPIKTDTIFNDILLSKVQNKILKNLDKDKIKLGQTIKIEKLYFQPDSSNIDTNSYAVLEEVYDFLIKNPKIKIEIGGHTNSQPTHDYCDKLSTARAKSVKDYIINKGISEERITYRGYGKRNPVASNDTKSGKALNQRVEIKIISIG